MLRLILSVGREVMPERKLFPYVRCSLIIIMADMIIMIIVIMADMINIEEKTWQGGTVSAYTIRHRACRP